MKSARRVLRTRKQRPDRLGRGYFSGSDAKSRVLFTTKYDRGEQSMRLRILPAVVATGVCAISLSAATVGHAQVASYPSKTIRMVIALAPGGGVDTTGRFIGQRLSQV